MNIQNLSFIAKLISTNPNEAKAIIKLASLEVLKSLGEGKYTISLDGQNLTAQSEKPLSEGAKYWSQLSHGKNSTELTHLIKQPLLFKNLQNSHVSYSFKEFQTILSSKNPQATIQQSLLEHITNATTKEEFTSVSTLLLSLQNHTFTIPLNYNNYFSILQFKKRYNKKTKKSQIDFYAALEFLGPISGLITLENGTLSVSLNVAFNKTKQFLEDNMHTLSYETDISVVQNIEPLYNANIESLLDISI